MYMMRLVYLNGGDAALKKCRTHKLFVLFSSMKKQRNPLPDGSQWGTGRAALPGRCLQRF
jgi:hypothetical protein